MEGGEKSLFFFFKLIVGAEPRVARVREGWKGAGCGRGRSEDEEKRRSVGEALRLKGDSGEAQVFPQYPVTTCVSAV